MEPEYKPANYFEPKTPDYNVHRLSSLLPGVLDSGRRQDTFIQKPTKSRKCSVQKPIRRRSPTNSERMNRALGELGTSAFKVHMLLWQWRGAPARGKLPYFTIHSLAKFCGLTRPTVRAAMTELVAKGWIQKQKYNKHEKNALYRLVALRNIP